MPSGPLTGARRVFSFRSIPATGRQTPAGQAQASARRGTVMEDDLDERSVAHGSAVQTRCGIANLDIPRQLDGETCLGDGWIHLELAERQGGRVAVGLDILQLSGEAGLLVHPEPDHG